MSAQIGFFIGIILSLVLAVVAFTRQHLDESGTLAALLIGVMVFSFGGWHWFALLVIFFASSNYFTHYQEKRKAKAYSEFAKGSKRDFWQVMANGFNPALLAVLYSYTHQPKFIAAFVAVIACITADTWATEIGVLASKPRLITSWKIVSSGTSGAISRLGFLATFGASTLIALSAVVLFVINASVWGGSNSGLSFFGLVIAGIIGGAVGSLSDSFLGATIQRMFYCNKCRTQTERPVHKCGGKTKFLYGLKWVDNDTVNFLSSIFAGIIATLVYGLFLR